MMRPILLVEDNEDDIFLATHAMRKVGLLDRLQVAQDGQKAIDFLQATVGDPTWNKVPCLILLDLKMPRVPGLEFLAWLRAQPELKVIPVVVLTSSTAAKDVAAAYTLGANSYFAKPPDSAALVELIQLFNTYWLKGCVPAVIGKPCP
jgi:two-component system response regulator